PFERLFIVRGRALKERIYPDIAERRRLYRTSLTPRVGKELLDSFPSIKEYFKEGMEYAHWGSDKKFSYIQTVIEKITELPKFNLTVPKDNCHWSDILQW